MPVAGPTFVHYFSLSLRSKIISFLSENCENVELPRLQRRVLEEEEEHVPLRPLGEVLLLRLLVLHLLPLRLQELGGVDVSPHVLPVDLEAFHPLVALLLLLRPLRVR